jgi:hypothetical protein
LPVKSVQHDVRHPHFHRQPAAQLSARKEQLYCARARQRGEEAVSGSGLDQHLRIEHGHVALRE